MARIAYVNGAYAPIAGASVNIQDRGYQFADGIYEVCLVVDGAWWDATGHLARLARSLDALAIREPMSERALRAVMAKTLRVNRLDTALVYLQVTRGVAPRNHAAPANIAPSLVVTVKPFDFAQADRKARAGIRVITQPDIRWGRADIKTVSLLPNTLARTAAAASGASEALLVREGAVTEGSSSNAWILGVDGVLRTRSLGPEILAGITREAVLDCARNMQMQVEEAAFSVEDAHGAREAFVTSATGLVTPVTHIDGKPVGSGAAGPVALRLRDAYIEHARRTSGALSPIP